MPACITTRRLYEVETGDRARPGRHVGAGGGTVDGQIAERRPARRTRAEGDDAAGKLKYVLGHFGSDFGNKTKKHPAALPFSAGYIEGVPRLGLPALFETDAGLGVATQATKTPRERTSLPSGLATTATWNRELAYQGGAMIGAEARASGFNVMLAGGVNLLREPRNGRNFEYAGEDPLLAGTMVAQQVRGIQSNNIIATMKHYAVNDQETGRFVLDARLDDASNRMSDLLAFQLLMEQADPGSVMCSYNRLNGVYACESDYLLNQVLKKDWGYKGYVMTDWGATHSTVEAANAGLDQQSGWEFDKSQYFGGALEEAVTNGHVPQARLDNMVFRVLRAMFAKAWSTTLLRKAVQSISPRTAGQPRRRGRGHGAAEERGQRAAAESRRQEDRHHRRACGCGRAGRRRFVAGVSDRRQRRAGHRADLVAGACGVSPIVADESDTGARAGRQVVYNDGKDPPPPRKPQPMRTWCWCSPSSGWAKRWMRCRCRCRTIRMR
jgi:beta-glucosidase-like glycosyl hydrolase